MEALIKLDEYNKKKKDLIEIINCGNHLFLIKYAFERYSMIKDNTQILFYFKEVPTNLDESDLEQLAKVNEFRQRIKPKCLYGQSFKKVGEFIEMLELHLPETIRVLKKQEKAKLEAKQNPPATN